MMISRAWYRSLAILAIAAAAPALAQQSEQAQDAAAEEAPSEAAPEGSSDAASNARRRGSTTTFEGFDFGQVVETMESSVSPLQTEMNQSFRLFTDRIREAERSLDEGRTDEAVQTASAAIDGVLAVRERVLEPMWEGQTALTEQTGEVRRRLARAVAADRNASSEEDAPALDKETEATLNNIAGRITEETDPVRKKRLTAHYRTVRNLARVKQMAQRLSPDQRKLWMNVLQVLDEAALAHQQVLMGSEVLFTQLEATSVTLREYLSLMETVDGASELLSVVRGAQAHGEGLSGFVASMNDLQDRLGMFNESVQHALEGRMIELEAQIDAIEPFEGDVGTPGSGSVISSQIDAELEDRIERLRSRGGGE